MSRVLENISKQILRENGIDVPRFFVVSDKKEACQAGDNLGYPVVIKALVPVGKRGKAGAVRFAENRDGLEKISDEILHMKVRNYSVAKLLVEKKIDITQDLYISVTIDPSKQMPVIIASTSGGMDIEEISKREPSKVSKWHVNILEGLHQYQAKEIWSDLGLRERPLQAATNMLWRLYQVFRKYDATILEVNPAAITREGKAVAAAVLMGVDDDALYRQPELSGRVEVGTDRSWRPLTQREKEMIAVDRAEPYRGTARYTEMEGGNIGLLCGGGGGSLLVYDTLIQYGGKPANYTEFGGNPTDTKVYGLTKGILSKPGVKGFLLDANITNNTQTDLVAKGIIKALQDLGIDVKEFPVVIRLAGVNELEAQSLFQEAGIDYHGDDITMEDAARLIVDKMKRLS